MESRIGLSPEELITIFNRMYLEVWAKTREKVDWESAKISKQIAEGKEVDIASLLVELMEVVITAARDGTILAIYENNEKVVEDLRQAGIELPARELTN
ncbi:MAG: hypothetical protein KC910_33410 [Candidatus Eremiobacteraeota bacterium]|nr:hypothetical protein [Candidatus Eremiobacteraeota bacterium]